MSRPAVLVVLVLVIIVGALVALAAIDTEVQPKAVEKPVTHETLGL